MSLNRRILALGLAVPAAFAGDGAVFLDPLTPPPSAETGQLTAEGTNMWFVELSSSPASMLFEMMLWRPALLSKNWLLLYEMALVHPQQGAKPLWKMRLWSVVR